MAKLWLLRGGFDAPGWNDLRTDSKEERVDIVHLDPKVWALVRADEAPTIYEGLEGTDPPDGLYIDPNGSPLYLAAGEIVPGPEDVIDALGDQAQALLEKVGDGNSVLERLGLVY